jgi:tetratricopeptide (TPR) repeat protein
MADPHPVPGRRSGVRENIGGEPGHKLAVLALGALGLAGALTVAAVAAPDRTKTAERYTPADPSRVIARVPARDRDELAARRSLADTASVDAAVQLARLEIQRYHRFSDPRHLGRAQATLARWWKDPDPPADVLLLRAQIRQSVHELPAARSDLDRLIAKRPDTNAHLLRAAVATITADYGAARESCAAIAAPLVRVTCEAPLEGLAGRAERAYMGVAGLLGRTRADAGVKGWALTALAELSIMQGDTTAAERHLREALEVDADDVYARNLLFDVLLETHRAAAASELLAGREHVDSHLVRLAISEHRLRSTDARRLADLMRERIEAAARRGDRIHLREEARFALAVERDASKALSTARDNWGVQKELADARLLVEAAVAAKDPTAAAPVIAWAKSTGVRDAWLDKHVRALEVR